jgi:hypothetical protein
MRLKDRIIVLIAALFLALAAFEAVIQFLRSR